MRKQSIVVYATMICALILALSAVVLAADPHVGTWKLNVAKSKFNSPAPKGFTVTIQTQDNGLKYVLEGFEADGKAMHQEWTIKYDGKDYPFRGDPSRDTMAFQKIDAHTFDAVGKKGGKEVIRIREVISQDGKTIAVTQEGKNEKGESVRDSFIVEKQ